MGKAIMTPENERWDEFVSRLGSEEGCDFKQKDPADENSITWRCNNSKERPFAKKILEEMGDINIEESMEYFSSHGGNCDCEILFNVDPVKIN